MPRFDIHIQTVPSQEQIDTMKFMSFGFTSTVAVKGFQLLINMWLKCFLTRRGTDPSDLSYGTEFTRMIGANIPLSDSRDITVLSIDQCNELLTKFQLRDTSLTLTERLASAELIDFVEKPSDPGFSATIELKNQANERLALNLPTFATG